MPICAIIIFQEDIAMRLNRKQMTVISFMLFSLFFGAGNLIFPPFLGQNAGSSTPAALIGFLITAVILPVLGVFAVAKFGGLDKLSGKVAPWFSTVFTVLIYLSIGPGLGIPRAASVPFEMAVAPYLPEGANMTLWMVLYSALFFLIACWLALNPSRLVDRIGKVLTPSLLTLLCVLAVAFVFRGEKNVAAPVGGYETGAFFKGFLEGYQTMDTIAALNFGLVIATTLSGMGLTRQKSMLRYTALSGCAAGTILATVYFLLSFMGMQSSGVYPIPDNGAVTLRLIVAQVFGGPGAILLAAIFTLACLTTCVGLINSISVFFSRLFPKVSYTMWVLLITFASFLICNLGLGTILSISIPILNAVYPVSILLIVLAMTDGLYEGNKIIYPVSTGLVAVLSILYSLEALGLPLGIVSTLCKMLPLYDLGLGWVLPGLVCAALCAIFGKKKN